MNIRRGPNRAGFTLIELLVVVAIIGIIISLILVAASDGVRRAEERATQSLITKLDFAVADRIDALFNTQAPINQTHRFLAAINVDDGVGGYTPIPGSIEARAQVIAQNDFIRAELPDVFFLNSKTVDGKTLATRFPLNFAGTPYPSDDPSGVENFILPLGHTSPGINSASSVAGSTPTGGTGIFGASYAAAGGIYKNLGYRVQAYDGVDNNGTGIIDEYAENKFDPSNSSDKQQADLISLRLSNHTHKTSRSEMLYAILVEGLGPLGSVFSREDFTNKEVSDTDNDGLPEFVDAWGEPLQFYRWPIYYGAVSGVLNPPISSGSSNPTPPGVSDSQHGYAKYLGAQDVRQQDTLDSNQQLVAPGWWYKAANPKLATGTGLTANFEAPNQVGTPDTSANMSQGAIAFTTTFRSLVDPMSADNNGSMWDRSNAMNRRAYFSKFLILSSGPDKEPGVGQFDKDYNALIGNPGPGQHIFTFPNPNAKIATNAKQLILIENQASQTDPTDRSGWFYENPETTTTALSPQFQTTDYLRSGSGLDDITNHNISAPGTGVR